MNHLTLDFHLARIHHRRHQLRAFILEIIHLSPTLDTSALDLIETDLADIADGITALQASKAGGGGFTQADLDAATAAGAESQLAGDQAAFAAGISPVQAALDKMKTQLAGSTSSQGAAPLSVQPAPLSTASVAAIPLSGSGSTDPQQAPGLTVSPTSVTGQIGSPLNVQFTVDGGVAPYSFNGTPPTPLSLSPNGVLSGTAAMAVSDQFSMTVTDSSGIPLSQSVSVGVSIT